MFERFTTDARAAVVGAKLAADSLGDREINREHLLVGLAVAGEPTLAAAGYTRPELEEALRSATGGTDDDAAALSAIGVDMSAIKDAVERNFGTEAWDAAAPVPRRDTTFLARLLPSGIGRFSPGAKKTLELALREAIADRSKEITTTYVLRGLLRDPGPTATAVISTRMSVGGLRERAGASG